MIFHVLNLVLSLTNPSPYSSHWFSSTCSEERSL